MTKELICDKCKKAIRHNFDDYTDENKKHRPVVFEFLNKTYDLCYGCSVLLEKFLDRLPAGDG